MATRTKSLTNVKKQVGFIDPWNLTLTSNSDKKKTTISIESTDIHKIAIILVKLLEAEGVKVVVTEEKINP